MAAQLKRSLTTADDVGQEMPPLETTAELSDFWDTTDPFLDGALTAVRSFWPLFLLVAVVFLARLGYQLYRLRRLSRSGIADVDQMDGVTFERFLGTLFRRLGYSVELTRHRGDHGADLVITKDGHRTAVQAKRWSKRIGGNAIQEAVASKGYYRCDSALVVANRKFTQQARVLARANDVELWGREVLVSKLLGVKGESAASEHAAAPGLTVAPEMPLPEAAGPTGIESVRP